MEICIAKNAGFCFGVRRATDTVEALIKEREKGGRLYTLGHLIHNGTYNRMLEEQGVLCIEEGALEDAAQTSSAEHPVTVVVRTHGIPRELEARLASLSEQHPHFRVIDCTCPYVKKIHAIAEENSGEGKLFLLLGSGNHPEVRSIMSHVNGEGRVFRSSSEVEAFVLSGDIEKIAPKTVTLAAQTTQNLEDYKKSQKILKKGCTSALIFDTICKVTENRQTEADQLSREMDGMIVIGGRDSSNTHKLYDLCRANCPRTYWIETAEDLDLSALSFGSKVGIAAGASTPDGIIQEVFKTMAAQTTENFAEMLESSLKTLNTGDTVVGVVTSVAQNEIHLDLGAKATGVIAYDQLTDDPTLKLADAFKVGDEVEAFVVRVSDLDGIITLSKKRVDAAKNWTTITAAYESGETLEGRIVEVVRGGVIIVLNSVKVFIPASMTGVPKDQDLSVLLGTTQKVKIVEIKEDRKKAYASIRAVLREERRAIEEKFWAEIEEGKQYTGTVKTVTACGAIGDLGGVDVMVHSSELSWRRIKHPSEVVSVGETITVYVKSFDPEKKRISLGYKTEESDPWYIFTHKYAVGDTAEVKIVSLMPFGAFAEVVPGADGLIHISQIAKEKIGKPADVLAIGQTVDAKIIGIDEENRKISLSIRALLEDAEEAVAEEAVEEANDGGLVYSTDAPTDYQGDDAE